MSVCVLVFGRHSMLAAAFAFVLLTLFVYVYACNACVRVLDTIRKKQVHTHTHTHTHHLLYIASNCTHACEWELSPDGSSKFLGVSILQGECLSTTNPPPPWSARRRKPILRSRSRTWARKKKNWRFWQIGSFLWGEVELFVHRSGSLDDLTAVLFICVTGKTWVSRKTI